MDRKQLAAMILAPIFGFFIGTVYHFMVTKSDYEIIAIATQDIDKGARLMPGMYKFSRTARTALPSNPILPANIEYFHGRVTRHEVVVNEPLRVDSFER